MSKYETELRRRLARDQGDIYEAMSWFLAAIDFQAYVDGKPGQPDLSEFEEDFLTANLLRYQQARLKRMSIVDLVSHMVLADPDPNQPKVDMSGVSDSDIINALCGSHSDSAAAELVKRASAKRLTMADFLRDVLAPDTR